MALFSRESEWRIKLPQSDVLEPPISTRISVRLEALRNKQHAVLKKWKFMKKARRTFSFSDVELKTSLKDRQPDKELLLYLFSEKKRFLEKSFFAEVATKKCQVITDFYSDCKDRLIDIMDQTSHMSSNPEAEQLLQSFHDDITGRLEEARKKLLIQRNAVDKKSKDVAELEYAMNKEKMEMGKGLLLLKEKLSKGEILNDQEILQLSLGTCLDTNRKLVTAVQSHGQQSDELQERFIWKRDEFVNQLAKDHQKALLRIVVPREELAAVDGKSDPPTPKGSMHDIIFERNEMIGALARIGQTTEETAKFHYKLRDLKQRIRQASKTKSLEISRSSEHSMITVISNIRSSVNPSSLQLSSSKKIK